MHGARRAAFDYIRSVRDPGGSLLWREGSRLFDVCCGDPPWLREHAVAQKIDWYGVDQMNQRLAGYARADLRQGMAIWRGIGFFDMAVTVYGLQHLQDDEATGWRVVHSNLSPNGYFLYFGNHAIDCYRNDQRQDPANVHSVESLKGMALATGFEVLEMQVYDYEPTPKEGYSVGVPAAQANGIRAMLRKRA